MGPRNERTDSSLSSVAQPRDRSVQSYVDSTGVEITVVTARFGVVFDRGLAAFLRDERDMLVLGHGLDLGGLEGVIARESPRVAILGEAALASSSVPRRLRAIQPDVGLVALVSGASERDGRQLSTVGVTCVAQGAAWFDISAAIRFAAEGQQIPMSAASSVHQYGHESRTLTRREWDVFQLVRAGYSNPEIASALQIGVETVRSHVQRLNRKLGVTRRRDLLVIDRPERLG
jgi:DNA-binding NarL/FixJ family response regulator